MTALWFEAGFNVLASLLDHYRMCPCSVPHAAPTAFRDAWRRDGAVLIPDFLTAPETRRLIAFVGDAYRVCDGLTERNDGASANLLENFIVWHGIDVDDLESYFGRRDPTRFAELRAIRHGVHAAVSRTFGINRLSPSRLRRVHARSFFRRHKDDAKYVPWHIDADAAATAAIAPDCFNVWLPLAEVGETAPSLEFVLGSHRWMRGVPLFGPDVTERYRSEEWITAHATGQHWIPVLKPGDAVLFDQYTLHRTQRTEFPIQSRDACEFRFMPVPWSWLHRAGPILGHQARRVVRHFMPRKQRAQ